MRRGAAELERTPAIRPTGGSPLIRLDAAEPQTPLARQGWEGGEISGVSRTWSPGPDGGTYGQVVEGIPVALASPAVAGPAGSLRMLVNQAEGLRANVGLVNVSGLAVTVTVEVATADGQPAPGTSTLTVPLLPYDMRQVDDVLAGLPAGDRQGLIVRASVSDGDGAILAYLFEVDNTTNSGSYQEAFRFGY